MTFFCERFFQIKIIATNVILVWRLNLNVKALNVFELIST